MIYQMKEEKQMTGEKEKRKLIHEKNNKGIRIQYERKNQMIWNERIKENGKNKNGNLICV